MKIVHQIRELREILSDVRREQKSIGFVPTMGALHAGHAGLMEACKLKNDLCVVSIYVNPTQFGPNEDLSKYPRPIESDTAICRKKNVDILFISSNEEMYPTSPTIFVDEKQLSTVLCGAFRPGHFEGVCTVVNKFLNIVQPNELFLGQKDAQQLRILTEMVHQLHLPVQVTSVPTYREHNGLAMSSRNIYLSEQEKTRASIIFAGLSTAKEMFDAGERKTKTLLAAVLEVLQRESTFKSQYIELLGWKDFQTHEVINQKSLLAVAGFMNETRLIDNMIFIP